ncbi:DNA/RNA nuclease SfsA [Clostridium sp. DL1XJH146]
MIYEGKTEIAKFINRPHRFGAYVNLRGEELYVYVPNTGRCREILIPGCNVVLERAVNPDRKTKYSLIAGYKGNKLINIDSQVPNKVVDEALKNKRIEKLLKYKTIKREKTFGKSRFDFKLSTEEEHYFLEIKGVTLENEGICMFPDAPTERGARHLLELIDVKKEGMGAGVLFLIQLDDAKTFSPNYKMDKKFGDALRLARLNDVDVFCYDCNVCENSIQLNKEIKVVL